jgi:peptide deformylase
MTATATFDLETWLNDAPALPPIVQVGDGVLRQRAAEVPSALFGTPALRELVVRMTRAMHAAPGVGLAAPQIGVPLRVFVAEDNEQRLATLSAEQRAARARTVLPLLTLVNPTLLRVGEASATFYEGCLSVRGYGALVERAHSVVASGWNTEGEPLRIQLSGWPARILQHEMDHLDGTLYVDRMVPRSLAAEAHLPRLSEQLTVDKR